MPHVKRGVRPEKLVTVRPRSSQVVLIIPLIAVSYFVVVSYLCDLSSVLFDARLERYGGDETFEMAKHDHNWIVG